jgi:dihydrofolate synthase/folylpolyglutamate synthase
MADFARSAHAGVQAQLDRLSKTSPVGDRLGLERIAAVLERLGRPQDKLPPVFHVAGTNGKGSTCAFLRAAFEADGKSVHMFTSPHLVRFNERIRVAGKLIGDEELSALLTEVIDAGAGIEPSFFEVAAAVAILAFARAPADACILEVGLGGRLDATNVIERPAVCGVASIGLDHQALLGETLGEIAGEKAAIAKPGVPLVGLAQPAEAEAAIIRVASAAGPPLLLEGRDWAFDPTLIPALPGPHQAWNANLAWQMLAAQDQVSVSRDAFVRGLATAQWPARMQLLGPGPLTAKLPGRRIWLDGGHNHEAAVAIAQAMTPRAPFDLIFALLKNRRVEPVLGPLAPLVRLAQVVPIPGHEHHDPRDIAWFAQEKLGSRDTYPAFTVREAIERLSGAYADGATDDVLIFGSLYLAGQVLEANEEIPD